MERADLYFQSDDRTSKPRLVLRLGAPFRRRVSASLRIFVVIRELDGLKLNPNTTGMARAALRFLKDGCKAKPKSIELAGPEKAVQVGAGRDSYFRGVPCSMLRFSASFAASCFAESFARSFVEVLIGRCSFVGRPKVRSTHSDDVQFVVSRPIVRARS